MGLCAIVAACSEVPLKDSNATHAVRSSAHSAVRTSTKRDASAPTTRGQSLSRAADDTRSEDTANTVANPLHDSRGTGDTEASRGIAPVSERLSASAVDAGSEPAQADAGSDGSRFDCPEVPTAYVFERGDEASAAHWLEAVGFDVKSLPLDSSPWRLRGAIVFGSGVSAEDEYKNYVKTYASDLYNFVDKANVLVELEQDAESEAEPPFLPSTHGATRSNLEVSEIRIPSPGRSLVNGFSVKKARLPWSSTDSKVRGFSDQDGFEILLQEADGARAPVLLEGAYGQGRMVLSQLPFDQAGDSGADGELAQAFFGNLLRETNRVCRRTTDALAISAGSISGVIAPGSSVLAVLPDTQVYSLRYPGLLTAQTSFIASNVANLSIKYVFGLGDITNNSTDLEWQHAVASISLLNGRVPYALVPGNHDYGPSGDASVRRTKFNQYFRADDQGSVSGLGGVYQQGHLENSYHLFSIAGHDYILFALEWGPRDEVLDWANAVMDQYPDRLGVMTTHAYLNNDNRRYDHTDKEHSQDYNPHEYATPGVNDGQEMWDKLIKKHPFVLTINGHVLGDGSGYLESETEAGTVCHQMLVNYQMRKLGGEAYLRLLEFPHDEAALRVWSYSPLYDDFLHDTDQEFEIKPFP